MKLTVIGFGQCGGRVADEFVQLNTRAKTRRGLVVSPAVFAVNTDTADLSGLKYVPNDFHHRILIGGRRTGGHGVGKLNELAAQLAEQDCDKVFHAINRTDHAFDGDAFMLVASTAGGTGSGSISVMTKILKQKYPQKPVYAMCVTPFDHEEQSEERTLYNTAVCLKSISMVADAVFLVGNNMFVGRDLSLAGNIDEINRLIVEPFYEILCAGEETKLKHVGAKTLDAGDIIQTLKGWTVIGYGRTDVPVFKNPFGSSHFHKKSLQTQRGIEAMDRALSGLSFACDPKDATRALYLVAGPKDEINVELVGELGEYLRDVAPKATIRNGDYPREKASLCVSVVLSGINDLQKVREYYTKSVDFIPEFKKRQEEGELKLEHMDSFARELPVLLGSNGETEPWLEKANTPRQVEKRRNNHP